MRYPQGEKAICRSRGCYTRDTYLGLFGHPWMVYAPLTKGFEIYFFHVAQAWLLPRNHNDQPMGATLAPDALPLTPGAPSKRRATRRPTTGTRSRGVGLGEVTRACTGLLQILGQLMVKAAAMRQL